MTAVRIRRGGVEDAADLAALAERAFRAAFADQNESAHMEAYAAEAFTEERLRAELAADTNTFLLAEAPSPAANPADEAAATAPGRGALVGYLKLRAGPADPSVRGPAPVEIERLYADPDRIGRGIGTRLMEAGLDAARRAGFRTVWLGVWERNPASIAFYERRGFAVVGTHVFQLGPDAQTDFIMERSVPDRDPERETAAVKTSATHDR